MSADPQWLDPILSRYVTGQLARFRAQLETQTRQPVESVQTDAARLLSDLCRHFGQAGILVVPEVTLETARDDLLFRFPGAIVWSRETTTGLAPATGGALFLPDLAATCTAEFGSFVLAHAFFLSSHAGQNLTGCWVEVPHAILIIGRRKEFFCREFSDGRFGYERTGM